VLALVGVDQAQLALAEALQARDDVIGGLLV